MPSCTPPTKTFTREATGLRKNMRKTEFVNHNWKRFIHSSHQQKRGWEKVQPWAVCSWSPCVGRGQLLWSYIWRHSVLFTALSSGRESESANSPLTLERTSPLGGSYHFAAPQRRALTPLYPIVQLYLKKQSWQKPQPTQLGTTGNSTH